jgi:AcrR family transcriptional regulator
VPSAVEQLRAADRSRADARRNADRLLVAARTALDEQGLAPTTRDVARRAGVGLGTLYRRFPSLDALFTAIVLDLVGELTTLAETGRHDPDPVAAFHAFATRYVQLLSTSRGLHEALSRPRQPELTAQVLRLSAAVRRLVRHAQECGTVRADLDWRDVAFALASAVPAEHTVGVPARPDQWRRTLDIVLAGLAPAGASLTADVGPAR